MLMMCLIYVDIVYLEWFGSYEWQIRISFDRAMLLAYLKFKLGTYLLIFNVLKTEKLGEFADISVNIVFTVKVLFHSFK